MGDLFELLSDASCQNNLVACIDAKYSGDSNVISGQCRLDCVTPFFLCVSASCADECSATLGSEQACTECVSLTSLGSEPNGIECSREFFQCGIGVACEAPWSYGDGACNAANNVASCLYDGGDCCGSTCVDGKFECGGDCVGGFECENFECLDPLAELGPFCINPLEKEFFTSPARYPVLKNAVDSCSSLEDEAEVLECVGEQLLEAEELASVSLGCVQECAASYAICTPANCPQCADDMFSESCLGCANVGLTFAGTGPGFVCERIFQSCAFGLQCFEPLKLQDGQCDLLNNSFQCDYDGGDCCEESCIDDAFTCGSDPEFNCVDPEQQPGSGLCTTTPADIDFIRGGTFLEAGSAALAD